MEDGEHIRDRAPPLLFLLKQHFVFTSHDKVLRSMKA